MSVKAVFKQGQVFNPNRFTPNLKPEKQEKKKPKNIKPLSDKRAAQNKVYLTLRKVYMDNHPICEIGGVGCTKKATDLHHLLGRIGKLLTDVNNFSAVCRNCHDKIHN